MNSVGTRVYVTNQSDGTVSVIDTTNNNAVSATITVGSGPRGVAVTADGSRVYVTNSSNVSAINTTTNGVIATITVGSNPRGIATLG